MNQLYDDGWLTDAVMMEWLASHTNVIYQPPIDHPAYNGINPYTLGFSMYRDIRRICEQPTEEDRRWFPDLAGTPWLPALHHAMRNFKDESFIGQYLSPHLMRELRLFAIHDDAAERHLRVSAIHDEDGYHELRQTLSRQYDIGVREPNIQVWDVDRRGDRTLTLRHTQVQGRPLADDALEVLKHVARLWGFGVKIESVDSDGEHPTVLHVLAPPQ